MAVGQLTCDLYHHFDPRRRSTNALVAVDAQNSLPSSLPAEVGHVHAVRPPGTSLDGRTDGQTDRQ
eukprot:2511803-Rhodomonas_salina.1